MSDDKKSVADILIGRLPTANIFREVIMKITELAQAQAYSVRYDEATAALITWIKGRGRYDDSAAFDFLTDLYRLIVPFSKSDAKSFAATKAALLEWAVAMWDWRKPTETLHQRLFWFIITVGMNPDQPTEEVEQYTGPRATRYCLAGSGQLDAMLALLRARLDDVRADDPDDTTAIKNWVTLLIRLEYTSWTPAAVYVNKLRSLFMHAHTKAQGWDGLAKQCS